MIIKIPSNFSEIVKFTQHINNTQTKIIDYDFDLIVSRYCVINY